MGSSYLLNPLEFLLTTLVSLYIMVLMLRFILGWARADFYNPVSQFLVRLTNPVLIPLRRLVPSIGRLDTSAVLLMLVLQGAVLAIAAWLHGAPINPLALLLRSVGHLVELGFNVFIFAIIIQVVLSWVNPGAFSSPVSSVLYSLTEPVLGPVRRLIPPVGGIDLSPMAAILGLVVAKMLVVPPLLHLL